ncbi:MAG: electron transport complex subunit RsxC [Ruminococcus sp.]|nr:electron transport complex subunit RsxC [Ruminococcus sp.]
MSELSFPKRPYRTKGGVHVPHHKNTAHTESVEMPIPKTVTIPMSQHIGAPCTPLVKPGDIVDVGQKIAQAQAFVSAPIHASVSGKVKKIEKITMPDGSKQDAIVIESDGEQRISPDIRPPKVESLSDLLTAVRESGLVGLGGAGFPASVKLNIPSDKNVDTLIINVAECEPYITADHREVLENSWDVMSGIHTVKEFLNIHRVIIGIENNKPDAIKALSEIAYNGFDPENEIRVLPLKATYPQGAEKILIKACTGREVPEGGLPSDAGCLVMNTGSVAFIARYLKTGMPLISRRLTVDGSAIKNPQNVIVPIGTPIKDVINFVGGYKEEPKKILMGGPMMGLSLYTDELFIQKQNNAILAFGEKEARLSEPSACIRCGKCVSACPMSLMPLELSNATDRGDLESLKKLHILNCMECGCCSYSCPAKRHLVQNIRLGKQLLNKAKKEQINKGGKK